MADATAPGADRPAPPSTDYDELWEDAYGDLQDLGPVHRHLRRRLRALLEPLTYQTVLDVGCGAGHDLSVLGAHARVTGLDVSEAALRRARERGAVDTRRADIQTDPVEGTWDLVFSSLVLEHLPDDEGALRTMHAACGAHLVLATMAGDFERYRAWDEQVGHVRNYARGELERKLEAAGFDVRRSVYWGFPFYSPIARLAQNRASPEPSFSPATRALAAILYRLYFLNSARRGDLLLVHATPRRKTGETP